MLMIISKWSFFAGFASLVFLFSCASTQGKAGSTPAIPLPKAKLPEAELVPYAADGVAEAYKIQGFEVEWHNDKKDKAECLRALQTALYQLKALIPPAAFSVIRSKQLVFSEDPKKGAAAAYFGGTVTIYSKKEFLHAPLRITLHELAHAYDDSYVKRTSLKAYGTYEYAMRRKIYNSPGTGVNEYDLKNYLTSNPEEYFAELTCTYFIGLHYFPFNRETLKAKDPEGYQLIEDAWLYQKGRNDFPEVEL